MNTRSFVLITFFFIHGVVILSHTVYRVKAAEIVSAGSSSSEAISFDQVLHRKLVTVEPYREPPKWPPTPVPNDGGNHLPPPRK
ncbi:hypothetical protein OWV82_007664 [Melia azedarach]|uniref:Uncharacterized protein n=1 Tax=Melia azedarach TaxID=155640 RepID=A0ACC1Y9T2_MELAZ|nr:hypothetical protein OWV82_007664 [Melia azedarach]